MTDNTPTPAPDEEISVSPATEPKAQAAKKTPPAPIAEPKSRHVYGNGLTDDVLYSRVRDSTRTRKSLTVKHLQRRLTELGFSEASADRDADYGLLTARSVEQWQESRKYPVGPLTAEQFAELFEGDPNVRVVLD
jgi:peptidoglycan hydrolase-like protein with peptidoglycan-binding domain